MLDAGNTPGSCLLARNRAIELNLLFAVLLIRRGLYSASSGLSGRSETRHSLSVGHSAPARDPIKPFLVLNQSQTLSVNKRRFASNRGNRVLLKPAGVYCHQKLIRGLHGPASDFRREVTSRTISDDLRPN